MMRHAAVLLATLLISGCGDLPSTGDGVVALKLTLPATLNLPQGTSVQLQAVALDRNGDPVAGADIRWATPDTTVTVDETTGVVTGVTETGTGRVQATVGSLRSDLITFTLQPAPGT